MADVPVIDLITYPDPPDGYVPVSFFRTTEVFNEGVDVDVQTFEAYAWEELRQEDIQAQFASAAARAADNGEKILAFACSYVYETNVVIPNEVCIAGACWTIPTSVCIPLTNICMPVAGTTLLQTRRYRYWFCTQPIVPAAALARGIWWVLIPAIIGGLLATGVLVGVVQVFQGKITWAEFTQGFKQVLRAPGEIVKPLTEDIPWIIWGLGAVLIGTAVILPISMARAYGDAGISGTGGVKYRQALPGGSSFEVESKGGTTPRR